MSRPALLLPLALLLVAGCADLGDAPPAPPTRTAEQGAAVRAWSFELTSKDTFRSGDAEYARIAVTVRAMGSLSEDSLNGVVFASGRPGSQMRLLDVVIDRASELATRIHTVEVDPPETITVVVGSNYPSRGGVSIMDANTEIVRTVEDSASLGAVGDGFAAAIYLRSAGRVAHNVGFDVRDQIAGAGDLERGALDLSWSIPPASIVLASTTGAGVGVGNWTDRVGSAGCVREAGTGSFSGAGEDRTQHAIGIEGVLDASYGAHIEVAAKDVELDSRVAAFRLPPTLQGMFPEAACRQAQDNRAPTVLARVG